MKKLIALGLLLCMMLSVCSMTAMAQGAQSATVSVTIVTLEEGNQRIAMAQKVITVTDADKDGALTMNDALYLAHEGSYPGGVADGYAYSMGTYGLQLDKLWGVANGGSYGIDLNNKGSNGIGDVIKDGDFVTAYVYAYGISDTYAYFDQKTVSGKADDTVELTLYANIYDMTTWELVSSPVSDAEILIDGSATSYRTDAQGKVTITLGNTGNQIISAKKAGVGMVMPVCVMTVSASGPVELPEITLPDTGDNVQAEDEGCGSAVSGVLLLPIALAALLTVRRTKHED